MVIISLLIKYVFLLCLLIIFEVSVVFGIQSLVFYSNLLNHLGQIFILMKHLA